MQPLSIPADEVEGPGIYAIHLQYLQAPEPEQGAIGLVQVQEDHLEDLLPHERCLLEQFDLKGGGPCSSTQPETMKGIVVGYGGCEAAI